jgi:phosphate transport system substrate-binding protein
VGVSLALVKIGFVLREAGIRPESPEQPERTPRVLNANETLHQGDVKAMRILSLFLVTFLALGSLSGCSRDSGSSRALIQNKGSDTLVNVAQAWAEAYKTVDSDVAVAVSGGGSGTGISALINGTVDIANSSRQIKPEEAEMAQENGVNPIEFVVGYDALAIFVHPDNPIESITLEQLAEIYGEGGTLENWSQLGITIPDGHDEIVRLSRQNNSGTYVYFSEVVLGKNRDFKLGSRDLHGSKDVVETVANTPSAIGYSGLAYATDHVKMVPILDADGNPVAPTVETAVSGTYPIARPLFMYTAGEPTGKVKEYMDWILSPVGQKVIFDKGYAPAGPTS